MITNEEDSWSSALSREQDRLDDAFDSRQNGSSSGSKRTTAAHLSFAESVESYFAKGVAEAEQEHKPSKVLRQRAGSGSLGSILKFQLVHLQVVTRETQTDWKWVTMAARWRHARMIKPSWSVSPVKIAAQKKTGRSSCHLVKRSSCHLVKRSSCDIKRIGSLKTNTDEAAAPDATEAQQQEATRQSVVQRIDQTLDQLGGDEAEAAAKTTQAPDDQTKAPIEPLPDAVTDDVKAHGVRSVVSSAVHSKTPSRPGSVSTRTSAILSKRRSRGSGALSPGSARGGYLPELFELNECDKMVDTVDLDFDPYDPDMVYTPLPDKYQAFVNKQQPRGGGAYRRSIILERRAVEDILEIEEDLLGPDSSMKIGGGSSAILAPQREE